MAADVIVGAEVASAQQIPLAKIDHTPWDRLLNKYVDQQGMVDYRGLQASAVDSKTLDDYLLHLSHANGQGSREEKLAFWINAYNALTIKGILREYPTSSIRNHTAVLFGYNIWKNLKLRVAGQAVALESIEHDKLRGLGDPRIHFAIVCASKGCPQLRAEAYSPHRIDAQLSANAKQFFSDPNKFQFDEQRRSLALSPVLKWFAEDFGNDQTARLQRIAGWLPNAAAQRLAASGTASVRYLTYDWALNDQL